MKILVQFFNKKTDSFNENYWNEIKSKMLEFKNGDKLTKISNAKNKLLELKNSMKTNTMIRVLEYHNDEPDLTRISCKILLEFEK